MDHKYNINYSQSLTRMEDKRTEGVGWVVKILPTHIKLNFDILKIANWDSSIEG